jgi:hypothetical protein
VQPDKSNRRCLKTGIQAFFVPEGHMKIAGLFSEVPAGLIILFKHLLRKNKDKAKKYLVFKRLHLI